jgi:RimJ/RimL family protein N-acetyltransferase
MPAWPADAAQWHERPSDGQERGMLKGERVLLRARREADVAVLHRDLYDDVETRSRADSRPWQPIAADSAASPYAMTGPAADVACFTVVDLTDERDEPAGEALLWGIDAHNRGAHIGLSLRPAFRGRGLGADAVRVLCRYGFDVRGLHRLQVETLADNQAMIRAAVRCGFTPEGTLRRSAWVGGEFLDEVILGLLGDEWRSGGRGASHTGRADPGRTGR